MQVYTIKIDVASGDGHGDGKQDAQTTNTSGGVILRSGMCQGTQWSESLIEHMSKLQYKGNPSLRRHYFSRSIVYRISMQIISLCNPR